MPDAIEDIKQPESLPETVDEAVEQLISDIPLKDKAIIANMTETELDGLSPTLGTDIRTGFRLWTENEPLLESCRLVSGQKDLHPDSASQMIIRELWKRLRKTHKLKVVK